MLEGEGDGEEVGLADALDEGEGDGEEVGLADAAGDPVDDALGLVEGDGLGVGVVLGLIEGFGVALTAGLTEALGVDVGVGVGVSEGEGSGVGLGEGELVSPRTCGEGKNIFLRKIPEPTSKNNKTPERIKVGLEGRLKVITALYSIPQIFLT